MVPYIAEIDGIPLLSNDQTQKVIYHSMTANCQIFHSPEHFKVYIFEVPASNMSAFSL